MGWRTLAQLGLLAMGIIVWAAGARRDDGRLTLIGVAFFAAATLLRLFKRKQPDADV